MLQYPFTSSTSLFGQFSTQPIRCKKDWYVLMLFSLHVDYLLVETGVSGGRCQWTDVSGPMLLDRCQSRPVLVEAGVSGGRCKWTDVSGPMLLDRCQWRPVLVEAGVTGGRCQWRPVLVETSVSGGRCQRRPVFSEVHSRTKSNGKDLRTILCPRKRRTFL